MERENIFLNSRVARFYARIFFFVEIYKGSPNHEQPRYSNIYNKPKINDFHRNLRKWIKRRDERNIYV